ncbi:MAG: TIGR01212 family radical SAM protein [Spirochaetales bacterium]|nr:TIGR01212 family radical SAM protein [Spirochaetales bacterium]
MKINSLSGYLKKQFGTKVYKLSLSAGCTCPTRDGTISYGGCIFCSEGGSGDFASSFDSIEVQIEKAKQKVESKFPKKIPDEDRKYIAYFQSFTSTYGNEERLMKLFETACSLKEIAAVSIGTRPDCISDKMLSFLSKLNRKKPVWIELGLQTIHQKSADFIKRGYCLPQFEKTYYALKKENLTVIVHLILGLPGETENQMLESVKYLASLSPVLDGIKLQLLQVLEGTELAQIYKTSPFKIFTMEEYANLLVKCLKLLPQQTVVHRITGDGPKRILIEPKWCGNKKAVLNYLTRFIDAY